MWWHFCSRNVRKCEILFVHLPLTNNQTGGDFSNDKKQDTNCFRTRIDSFLQDTSKGTTNQSHCLSLVAFLPYTGEAVVSSPTWHYQLSFLTGLAAASAPGHLLTGKRDCCPNCCQCSHLALLSMKYSSRLEANLKEHWQTKSGWGEPRGFSGPVSCQPSWKQAMWQDVPAAPQLSPRLQSGSTAGKEQHVDGIFFFLISSLLPSLSIPSKFQPAKWEGWFTMRQGFPSSTCMSPQDEEGTCHCGGTAVAIAPGFPASSNPPDWNSRPTAWFLAAEEQQ